LEGRQNQSGRSADYTKFIWNVPICCTKGISENNAAKGSILSLCGCLIFSSIRQL
jgi:hypothetical protein